MSEYSLKKSKKILTHNYRAIHASKKGSENQPIIEVLKKLQDAILEKNCVQASNLAKKVESLIPKKSSTSKLVHFIIGLGLALLVAVLIRQMWFELYEIPTGSMRPTFKEKDRVIVSKSKFGINFPLVTKHLYFNKDLCKRMGIFIFTVQNMNTTDSDMLYFYLFPGKKQFIKRLVGKPGDLLYFYGGQIYGVDKDGNDISNELQQFSSIGLEHIPFIRFEGTRTPAKSSSLTINQMGEDVVKLTHNPLGKIEGKFLGSNLYNDPSQFEDYYDLWGFKNYAFARLVTPSYVDLLEKSYLGNLSSYPLILEIHHSPSIKNNSSFRKPILTVGKSVSYIPLNQDHLERIFKSLYTARFVIKNGNVFRYGSKNSQSNVKLEGIPNGTYEFYDGIAYRIYPTGITTKLPENHPLYTLSVDRLQTFFNLGIEFNLFYSPSDKNDVILPSRYAYFRGGNLYLMGQPILYSDDPELILYNEIEQRKMRSFFRYHPFVDYGPPLLSDGSLNTDILDKYGLKVPENYYLALGDNHAMSGDSRDFGFVPEENIKGTPSIIFWPLGYRFGFPIQAITPWLSFPNITVYLLGIISLAIGTYISKRKYRLPIDFDKKT